MELNHSQLRELFIAACDLTEQEQEEFIAEHCSGHPELQTELKRLLVSDGETDGVFSDGNTSAGVNFQLDTVVDGEAPKLESTGRYQLQGEIARGGMGAIIEGRDTELGRDLAIKVLLDEHKDNPQIVQRFLEEAQITGQLQHPGIAPIYEVGQLADRRPFISMKLVKGETLASLLAKRKSQADDLGKLIGIFEQVCQTVAFAHSKNVVHRDLKPANIMVGAFGEVQVMDWGLAKILAPDSAFNQNEPSGIQTEPELIRTLHNNITGVPNLGSLTQAGTVMGTPGYMPPEQALGEIDQIDQRTDVFALGAILCEILTGKPIYLNSDNIQVLQMASSGDLAGCFQRLDQSDADVDLIALCKQCLCPEQVGRLKDGAVIADRIAGYLESVETRLRETEIERAAQSARADEERKRRRVTMALAATLVLAIILAGVGWTVFQNQKAEALAKTQTRINKLISDARLHQSLAESANDENDPKLENKVRELKLSLTDAREAVELAEELVELLDVESNLKAVSNKLVSELELQAETAMKQATQIVFDQELLAELELIRLTNGRGENAASLWSDNAGNEARDFSTELPLFDSRDASVMYERVFRESDLDLAVQDIGDLTSKINQSDIRESLIAALDNWARALQPGSNANSETKVDPNSKVDNESMNSASVDRIVTRSRLTALVNAVDDNAWRKQLRTALSIGDTELLKSMATNKNLAQQPGELVCWIAEAFRSERDFEKSVAVVRQSQQRNPDDFWLNYELGMSLSMIDGQEIEGLSFMRAALAIRPRSTGMLIAMSRVLQSLERFEEAEAADRRAIELDANFPHAHVNLGNADFARKRFDEALVHYGKAIEIDPESSRPFVNSGACFFQKGQYEEARDVLGKAIQLDPDAPLAYGNLGDVMLKQGELDNAIAQFQKMNEIDPHVFTGYFSVGQCLLLQRKPKEAIAQFEKVLEYNDYSKAHAGLANSYAALGQIDKSIEANRRAIELDPGYVKAYGNLGNAMLQKNKLDEALKLFEKALELDPDYSYGHFAIAYVMQSRGDIDAAIAEYRKAIAIKPDFGEVHVNLGMLLKRKGEFDTAISHYRKALAGNPSIQAAANAHHNIGNCFQESGELEKAIVEFRKAIEIRPDHTNHHVALGEILKLAGKLDEAVEALQIATTIKPASIATVRAHYVLGMTLDTQNRTAEAVDEFRSCVKLQPGYANGYAALGLALHKTGATDDATLALQQVLELAPDNTELHSQIAVSILSRKDENGNVAGLDDAIQFAKKANELKPKNPDCLSILGMAHYRNEQWQEALESFESSVKLFQSSNQSHIENTLFLAMTHWKLEDQEKARSLFAEAMESGEFDSASAAQQAMFLEAKELIK